MTSHGHLALQLMKWQIICERDRTETLERIRQDNNTAPAPAFMDRVQDDYQATDEMGIWAVSQKGKV